MNFEFEEDKYIYESLRMFGPLTPPEIARNISVRTDIPNWIKNEIADKYVTQKRCLMMVRMGLIKEADIEGERTPEGVWRYYMV